MMLDGRLIVLCTTTRLSTVYFDLRESRHAHFCSELSSSRHRRSATTSTLDVDRFALATGAKWRDSVTAAINELNTIPLIDNADCKRLICTPRSPRSSRLDDRCCLKAASQIVYGDSRRCDATAFLKRLPTRRYAICAAIDFFCVGDIFAVLLSSLVLVFVLLLAFTASNLQYMHLGITLTCMVNSTAIDVGVEMPPRGDVDGRCQVAKSTSHEALGYSGSLLWTPAQQSQLFSAFWWASIAPMAFSGAIADRYGPKRLTVGALVAYSALSILSPLAASHAYSSFLIIRILMGFTEGFVWPCLTSLVSRWVPPGERTTAAAIYSSGFQLAPLLSMLISTRICALNIGYDAIFYFFGLFGLLAATLFVILVSDSPQHNRFISTHELRYLDIMLHDQGVKIRTGDLQTPWRAILTSPAVGAICVSEFSYQFSSSLITGYLPSFFRDVLALGISENGVYNTVPYISQILFKALISVSCDSLRRRYRWDTTTTCKIMQLYATMGCALAFALMALTLDCTRPMLALALVFIYGMCFAGEIAGAVSATLHLAPAHTGTLSSLTVLVGSVGGVAAPTVVSYLNERGTQQEWAYIFYFAAGVKVFSGLVFAIFGSSSLQPWARVDKVTPASTALQRVAFSEADIERIAAIKREEESATL